MKRQAVLPVVLLAGLTLAHFDFGLADDWPRLAGLPGGLVWHGAFCLVAAGVFRVLAGKAGAAGTEPTPRNQETRPSR